MKGPWPGRCMRMLRHESSPDTDAINYAEQIKTVLTLLKKAIKILLQATLKLFCVQLSLMCFRCIFKKQFELL